MNDIMIRDLKPADVDTIAYIAVAAWTPIYTFYRQAMGEELFQVLFPDWQAEKARQVRSACEPDHPAIVCVVEQEGQVVGFVTFYVNESTCIGEIGNNAIRPDFQGRGIAARMYEHVFDRLKKVGMRYVRVSTGGDPSHAPARRAYEKAGFSVQLPGVDYFRKL